MELDDLREAGITRLRVHYSDLLGTTRAKVIPLELAEEAAEEGLNFCMAVFSIDHAGGDAGRDGPTGRGAVQ